MLREAVSRLGVTAGRSRWRSAGCCCDNKVEMGKLKGT